MFGKKLPATGQIFKIFLSGLFLNIPTLIPLWKAD